MFKIRWLCVWTAIIITVTPANLNAQSKEITVSAAMSLKNVFEEIKNLYEAAHSGKKIVLNFGASGDLARQIEAGAPVDVFASAAQKDMDTLEQKGLIISSSRADFAGNSVVLIKPASSDIQIKSFEDLTKPEVKKICIGNPQSVPIGRYAQEILSYLKVWDRIKDKLIFAENVRQILEYVAANETDAGIVYSTDALIKSTQVQVVSVAPKEGHKPVLYPIGVVKGSKNEAMARKFIALVLSEQGKTILQKNGFIPVQPK